ncbi:MAG: MBOAT family protein [Planctomycetes bacterium]|nr:MBOAT family protein [Planctomycetota bacterium]
MVFSAPIFVFLFLPLGLLLHAILPKGARNLMLLAGSLLFFYWGEQVYTLLMLVSIGANWAFGAWVHKVRERPNAAKRVIAYAVILNLALLGFFKYADFVGDTLSTLLIAFGVLDAPLPPPGALFGTSAFARDYILTATGDVRLPIGISFFTFQAMSYVIDVYRKEGEVQKNPFDFALYVTFFPQLIAGPIVRYRDVDQQIKQRFVDRAKFAYGVQRFIVGLSKKALIGDTLALPADQIFALAAPERSFELAWLGIICYALHLYFDFSGYSDMAIGMGKMFGFDFLENFDYPFISRSVTEFWRRWHISLSTWFRDYVYLPLGGNRKGTARTYFNLVAIFALCGMWHGAGWNYLIFGLFQGVFLVAERLFFTERVPDRGWWRHAYVLLVFVVTWVIFKAANMTAALEYIGALFGAGDFTNPARPALMYLDPLVATMIVVGVAASIPWVPTLAKAKERWRAAGERRGLVTFLDWGSSFALLALFVLSAMQITASTYSPFVYFRF